MAEKHTMEMLSAPEGGGTLTTLHDSNITGKKKSLEMIMSQTKVCTREPLELDHNCVNRTSEYYLVMFSYLEVS